MLTTQALQLWDSCSWLGRILNWSLLPVRRGTRELELTRGILFELEWLLVPLVHREFVVWVSLRRRVDSMVDSGVSPVRGSIGLRVKRRRKYNKSMTEKMLALHAQTVC